MNYLHLREEIGQDPLGPGYAGMANAQVAADLNNQYRAREREVIETWEIAEAIVRAELAALSPGDRELILAMLAMGTINLKGANVRATFAGIFGAGTTTRNNLLALQTETISRAQELGYGVIDADDIRVVRS